MLQKGCECREREMEECKQNWDEVFMDKVGRERERERRERKKERGGKEREEKKEGRERKN
jgi:hypothetical protein